MMMIGARPATLRLDPPPGENYDQVQYDPF